mgnify:CR=1 FL=1
MPANPTPIFPLSPLATPVAVGTANIGRDGTGTIATILTPGVDGARVDSVRLQATITTTAGVFRLWVRASAAGTWFLHTEILMTAITPSTTVQAWSYDWIPRVPLVLASGNLLGGSVHNAENVAATPNGASY